MIATQNLFSIGHLSFMLRTSVTAVRRAARELDMQPAVAINDLPHYDEDQAEQIRQHLANQRATRSAATTESR